MSDLYPICAYYHWQMVVFVLQQPNHELQGSALHPKAYQLHVYAANEFNPHFIVTPGPCCANSIYRYEMQQFTRSLTVY